MSFSYERQYFKLIPSIYSQHVESSGAVPIQVRMYKGMSTVGLPSRCMGEKPIG